MSPEMTKHYQAHADREAKEKYLSKLPDFISRAEMKAIGSTDEDLRRQLLRKIEIMPDWQLEKISAFLETL